MDSQGDYDSARRLAREKRREFPILSQNINLTYLRKIYSKENIKIKLVKGGDLRNLKAAYFNDEDGIDVILNSKLPNETKIFAMAHELKHHYLDSANKGVWNCLKAYGDEPLIEKTAEVFAAEFIWPEEEFIASLAEFGLTRENFSAERVIRFKRETNVPVSYAFVKKRLEWFKVMDKGFLDDKKLQTLEYQIFGLPYHLRKR